MRIQKTAENRYLILSRVASKKITFWRGDKLFNADWVGVFNYDYIGNLNLKYGKERSGFVGHTGLSNSRTTLSALKRISN
jgi:hypothetical protein